jgi:hypothetical protein
MSLANDERHGNTAEVPDAFGSLAGVARICTGRGVRAINDSAGRVTRLLPQTPAAHMQVQAHGVIAWLPFGRPEYSSIATRHASSDDRLADLTGH